MEYSDPRDFGFHPKTVMTALMPYEQFSSKTRRLILGIDIGIASVGVCLIDIRNHEIILMASHIFKAPVEGKQKDISARSSGASIRRGYRSVRRTTKRRKKQALHRRLYSIPTSSIKINDKRINYFNFLSSLEYVGCNRALERMMPRIDMDKIENIILNTPGIDQAEKEFYTGILKARKENILDYSANQLSREKGAITLTKELKRTVDRSLAAKEISSIEAAKKYSEVQNSQSGKDEILNEPNVKAADDSHFEGSSDNACL